MVNIRVYNDTDRRSWDEYVMGSQGSCCYHQPGWKNVIEKSFGNRAHYLLAEDSGKVCGIFPLVQLKSMIFGNFMVSLPYFNYGGICADTPGIEQQLLDQAIKTATDEKAGHIEMRHLRPVGLGLEEKKTKVSMKLELPGTPEELWKSFSSKLRNQINRPLKEAMLVRVGRHAELNNFYRVFSANMRDLGTPVYKKDFFRNILDEFPEAAWIITVCLKSGEPAAGGFFTAFKDTVEIPWASSLRSYNRLGPNMLLYWSGLKLACERGYRIFDFGRSTPGEGTYKFKEQWGAAPVQLYWHYWMRDGGAMPEINPKNAKYQMPIKIWQRLPIGMTRLIGPVIAKNLP